MPSIDDLTSNANWTTASGNKTVTFLPDPPRAERRYSVISGDDHIVESPDTLAGRVRATSAERAPGIVERQDRTHARVYDGREMPMVGFAVVGRPVSEWAMEPA